MIPWQRVPVTDLNGFAIYDEARRARFLRAFRDDGCCGAWLVSPEELEELGEDETFDAGPKADEIDWTGIDEVTA